ncbi:uncharacterized protein LOC8081610 [Sorghum bicolor]|uniref:uncharacterized protein LOC8081610 n=1 Tax=Sorghum bicolor TaxID=4558 RepID=UPI000B426578|nr:uncharacterized protein LOC8081610 [Sorghum bicolor]|eukprot:XP_021310219.1 uncharacterized protein LOC8081610 [Sorghum bicolor]
MAPRPPPAELMDELVEEILLRIPPDDPTRLLRAALVCKRWCRIVSAAGFRLRFRNGNGNGGTFAHVYSSEAAAWSKRISAQHLHEDIRSLPSALAGNALYFVCSTIILKYDLAAREMSVIHLPGECFFRGPL